MIEDEKRENDDDSAPVELTPAEADRLRELEQKIRDALKDEPEETPPDVVKKVIDQFPKDDKKTEEPEQ
jgi:hypothetical protein